MNLYKKIFFITFFTLLNFDNGFALALVNYGTIDGTSGGFSSSLNSALTNVNFQSADMATIRPWLGNSECPSCGNGVNKKQVFSFSDLALDVPITLTGSFWFSSSNQTFTATITSGSAIIDSGSSKTFTVGSQSSQWQIVIIPKTSNFSLTLTNNLNSGTNYIYVDSYKIDPGNQTATSNVQQNCIFLGKTIQSGSSTTAYQTSSVTSPNSCVSETRVCTNGVLSGSYTNGSCIVTVPTTSTSVAGNATVSTISAKNFGAIDQSSSDFTNSISAKSVLDVQGNSQLTNIRPWLGYSSCPSCGTNSLSETLKFANLAPNQTVTVTLTPWYSSSQQTFSASIDGGAKIISGATKSFAFGNISQSSNWVITFQTGSTTSYVNLSLGNGITGGTNYLYVDSYAISAFAVGSSGTATSDLSCNLNGQSILNGQSTTAYQTSSVTSPNSCVSETRVCTNGVLSGSYTNGSCIVTVPTTFFSAVNTLLINGVYQPAYKSSEGLISFVSDTKQGTVSAYLENNTVTPKWSANYLANGGMSGGLDFNQDGYPEVSAIQYVSTGQSCGASIINNGYLYLLDGKTGKKLTSVGPLTDTCWSSLGYASAKLTVNSFQYGNIPGQFVISPQYHTQGWFFHYINGNISVTPFITPLSSSFDVLYTNAKFSISNPDTKYVTNSQASYGILSKLSRYIAFASERISQYDINNYGSSQLLTDNTFKARSDIGGRTYGNYSIDSQNSNMVYSVQGTSVYSVYQDLLNGTRAFDVWASIERNFILFNMSTNQVLQRFYSYAHDNGDINQYVGRVVNVAHQILPSTSEYSHVIYNVFNEAGDGRFTLHISSPGSTSDAITMKNIFVWDALDLNKDGNFEIIASPITTSKNGYYYFPDWKTQIYMWDKTTKKLILKQEIPDVIPNISVFFVEENSQNSAGFTSQIKFIKEEEKNKILTIDKNKIIRAVDITF